MPGLDLSVNLKKEKKKTDSGQNSASGYLKCIDKFVLVILMKIDRILTVAWLLMCHQGAIDASLFVGPAEI